MIKDTKAALEKLKSAKWERAVTLNAQDGEELAGFSPTRFQRLYMKKALPAVTTTDPEITAEVCRNADILFNIPARKSDHEGIVFNADKGELMIFGQRNLGYMAYNGVSIPEAKTFAEMYKAQIVDTAYQRN